MFDTNGPNATLHTNAACNCASSAKLCDTGLNGLPASVFSSQNINFKDHVNDPVDINLPANQYPDNVISIATVMKPFGKKNQCKIKKMKDDSIEFIYPMLECSWPE